jgi:hypothetical protein
MMMHFFAQGQRRSRPRAIARFFGHGQQRPACNAIYNLVPRPEWLWVVVRCAPVESPIPMAGSRLRVDAASVANAAELRCSLTASYMNVRTYQLPSGDWITLMSFPGANRCLLVFHIEVRSLQ